MDFGAIFSGMNDEDGGESLHIIQELLNPTIIKSSKICQIAWKFIRPLIAIIAQISSNEWDDKFVRFCDKIMDNRVD